MRGGLVDAEGSGTEKVQGPKTDITPTPKSVLCPPASEKVSFEARRGQN